MQLINWITLQAFSFLLKKTRLVNGSGKNSTLILTVNCCLQSDKLTAQCEKAGSCVAGNDNGRKLPEEPVSGSLAGS